ncbi:expressed unknown protein [Seminavis robusta]|uniref:Secreted protein n=1 Tax=Seminavis robusta TaxID=568900 RepID=A0A9N8DBX6_9STRA|nr:expressed unknown protein [Seminavis robusta]|eukprot:Sro23_g016040.1 n/a (308) ;mRNA; f:137216-138216
MISLRKASAMILCWTLTVAVNGLITASSISWRPVFGLTVARTTPQPTTTVTTVPRGGSSSCQTSSKVQQAEETLDRVLEDAKDQDKKFHVQGWRWHTMSVLRDAERLQALALRTTGDDLSQLQKAADYVVDFNLKALHRVENMFFPWMRQHMQESKTAQPETKQAFNAIVENLEADQKRLAELGKSITQTFSNRPNPSVASAVATQSEELANLARSMLERELDYVIPTVGLCVPENDQQKFNNQVIKFLGVLEARVHLVHMHEVVTESKSDLEEQLWKESIPSLPRSLIPRWKRTLYEPMAGMLELQ